MVTTISGELVVKTPTKSPNVARSRRGSSATAANVLPGLPWSSQGALTRQNSNMMVDSPASISRKLNGSVQDMSFGPMSVWDGGDGDDFDLVTQDGDGLDEDVSHT